MGPFVRIVAKAVALLTGWLVAMLIPLSAIFLWRGYGGSVYVPEMLTLTAGHVVNAGLTIGLAAAISSFTEHPATAAILTLSVTIGTWMVNFFGAIQGGWWERAAGFTPAAMVAEFQHGLLRMDTVLVSLTLILAGLGIAAAWLRLGVAIKRRVYESAGIVILATFCIFGCSLVPANWDTSEARSNSFSEADEHALLQIRAPMRIEVHLAAEDPRRLDLEHRALGKLRRLLPKTEVSYVAATAIGLFEQTRAGYGEIWYELDGRRTMSRTTTEEGVLEAIYSLAGIAPPRESEDEVFRGHPLAVSAKSAGSIFYGFWPGIVALGGFLIRRRFQ